PRRAPVTLVALAACTPGDLTVEEADGIWLGRRLTVHAGRPSRLTVELSDGRGERTLRFPEVERRHEVPLVGFLPDDTVDYTITLADDRRETTWSGSFSTGELPPDFPQVDVLAAGPGAPGYTLVPLELNDDDYGFLAALDDEGRVVWAWRAPVQF